MNMADIDGYTTYSADVLTNKDISKRRKIRNESEKKRRDQFNVLIKELMVCIGDERRKMDKSTVLQATIKYLKSHNESVRDQRETSTLKPSFLENTLFNGLMLEGLNAFYLITTQNGNILDASKNISLLHHIPEAIIGTNLFHFIHVEDQRKVQQLFQSPKKDKTICNIQSRMNLLDEDADNGVYRLCNLTGVLQLQSEDRKVIIFFKLVDQEYENEILPLKNMDNIKFSAELSVDWKFMHLQTSAKEIIGFNQDELLGNLLYDFFHIDDLDKITKCHDTLIKSHQNVTCMHRFRTKDHNWIWLETKFCIRANQWNGKPSHITAFFTVVGFNKFLISNQKFVEKMSRKYHLNSCTKSSSPKVTQCNKDVDFMVLNSVAFQDSSNFTMDKKSLLEKQKKLQQLIKFQQESVVKQFGLATSQPKMMDIGTATFDNFDFDLTQIPHQNPSIALTDELTCFHQIESSSPNNYNTSPHSSLLDVSDCQLSDSNENFVQMLENFISPSSF